MNESESKENKTEGKPRFSQEQYDMLKRCSDKKDMTEWNEWRRQNPNCEILLEGACLEDAFLEGANLIGAKFCPESEKGHTRKSFLKVYHKRISNLKGANIRKVRLQNAILNGACLKGADMSESCLLQVDLIFADLQDVSLLESNLRNCVLEGANIKEADITRCNLRNANFRTVIVNDETVIWKPKVNKCKGPWKPNDRIGQREYTDFQGVPLDTIRTDPSTKQLLEYNIRRSNWEQWYLYKDWQGDCQNTRSKIHQIMMYFIRLFWSFSDYGRSTGRILIWFSVFALAFGLIYWLWPSCVRVVGNGGDLRSFLHAIYFSVVTMTTLGFGDIAANPDSALGQILLMLQVILGYILLGALVTRFAVLFTAGGPAGRFANEQEEKDKT